MDTAKRLAEIKESRRTLADAYVREAANCRRWAKDYPVGSAERAKWQRQARKQEQAARDIRRELAEAFARGIS